MIRQLSLLLWVVGLLAGGVAALQIAGMERSNSFYVVQHGVVHAMSGDRLPDDAQAVAGLQRIAAAHPEVTLVRVRTAADGDSGNQDITYAGDPSRLPDGGFTPGLRYEHTPVEAANNLFGFWAYRGHPEDGGGAVLAEIAEVLSGAGYEAQVHRLPPAVEWWGGTSITFFALLLSLALLAGAAYARAWARAVAVVVAGGGRRSQLFVHPAPVVALFGGVVTAGVVLAAAGARPLELFPLRAAVIGAVAAAAVALGVVLGVARVTPGRVRAAMGGDVPERLVRRGAIALRLVLTVAVGLLLPAAARAQSQVVPYILPEHPGYAVTLAGGPKGYHELLAKEIRGKDIDLAALGGVAEWQRTPNGPAIVSTTGTPSHVVWVPSRAAAHAASVGEKYPDYEVRIYDEATDPRRVVPRVPPRTAGAALPIDNPVLIVHDPSLQDVPDREISAALSSGQLTFRHEADAYAVLRSAGGTPVSGAVYSVDKQFRDTAAARRAERDIAVMQVAAATGGLLLAAILLGVAQGSRRRERARIRHACGWPWWRTHSRPLLEETTLMIVLLVPVIHAAAQQLPPLPAWAHDMDATSSWVTVPIAAAIGCVATVLRLRALKEKPWTSTLRP
ncbi:hypothetical protein C1Y63_03890 [Corynebacterium sp. 13CS0277]|nr:hypothetical protein C1Y63_03890 [Corynebacterium sp. 13CS0277]